MTGEKETAGDIRERGRKREQKENPGRPGRREKEKAEEEKFFFGGGGGGRGRERETIV